MGLVLLSAGNIFHKMIFNNSHIGMAFILEKKFWEFKIIKSLDLTVTGLGGPTPPEEQLNGNSHKKSPLLGWDLALCITFPICTKAFNAHSRNTAFIWKGMSARERGLPLSVTEPQHTSKYPSDPRDHRFPFHIYLLSLSPVSPLMTPLTSWFHSPFTWPQISFSTPPGPWQKTHSSNLLLWQVLHSVSPHLLLPNLVLQRL